MDQELLNPLIKLITIIPGIMGLASMDFSKPNSSLKEEKYQESFIFETKRGKLDIYVGLIVNDEIPMKIIAQEVFSSVSGFFKQKDKNLGQVHIYVRGIK